MPGKRVGRDVVKHRRVPSGCVSPRESMFEWVLKVAVTNDEVVVVEAAMTKTADQTLRSPSLSTSVSVEVASYYDYVGLWNGVERLLKLI